MSKNGKKKSKDASPADATATAQPPVTLTSVPSRCFRRRTRISTAGRSAASTSSGAGRALPDSR